MTVAMGMQRTERIRKISTYDVYSISAVIFQYKRGAYSTTNCIAGTRAKVGTAVAMCCGCIIFRFDYYFVYNVVDDDTHGSSELHFYVSR